MVPTSTRVPEFGPCTPPSAAPRPPAERVTVRQGFWRQQVEEIRADPALRASGVVLALVHLLGAIHWLAGGAASLLQRGAEPICWPLVPWCAEMRSFSAAELRWLLAGYAAAALGTAALFAHRRSVGWASVALAGLVVVKLFVLALDYRLRLNQHYMGVTVMLVFLAIPAKRDALRVLLALVYFWAGTLKLNWESISGAGLYRPLWLLTGQAVVLACAYVVVLELVVAWGLLARRRLLFWGALAQVALLHVMSWAVVGYYYPV